MARQNRRDIFDAQEVGVFHCIQRVVRASWLCVVDQRTGKSFEHRKEWVQAKLQELAQSFGIDCLSFSVMSNHFHVILRNRPDVVETWSDDDGTRRWWQLFPKRRDQEGQRASDTGFLAMSLESYLKLLDWTGRQLRRDDKRGRIPDQVAPILQRLVYRAKSGATSSSGMARSFSGWPAVPQR